MCGINGFNWRDDDLASAMNVALRHRGPDANGIFSDDSVSLGSVRLAIIDLSEAGKQPMANEDELIWLVYNGEIYNFGELRGSLVKKGHTFKSHTDSEVVLHAYEEKGAECVNEFTGMWAFALYDKRKNLIFMSRDRFGVKPVYYYHDGRRFIFSSELKGILQHDIEKTVNDKAVYEFLVHGLVDATRETFFKNIQRLMPGENLLFDLTTNCLSLVKWYDLRARSGKKSASSDLQIVKQVRDLFTLSVSEHLMADVTLGSCASGGIDSSAIVFTMRKLLGNQSIIDTFSMVFPGLKIDESEYVELLGRELGSNSSSVSPSVQELLDDLQDLVVTQEEPFESLSIYGQYRLMQLAHSKEMRVLLDGQGGDEILAGYPRYYLSYLMESLFRLRFPTALRLVMSGKVNLVQFIQQSAAYLLERFKTTRRVLNWGRRRRLQHLSSIPKLDHRFAVKPNLRDALLEDMTDNLPRLLRYEDKNSMRWSIEARVPFLDWRFVEFLFSLPSSTKIKGDLTKHCFRLAMEGIVPQKILDRRDKIGFATPDLEWFRAPAFSGFVRDVLESRSFKSRPYWDSSKVSKMRDDHVSGRADNTQSLMRVLSVELWHRAFIDKRSQDETRG